MFVIYIDIVCITLIAQKGGKVIELYKSNVSIFQWN